MVCRIIYRTYRQYNGHLDLQTMSAGSAGSVVYMVVRVYRITGQARSSMPHEICPNMLHQSAKVQKCNCAIYEKSEDKVERTSSMMKV